jgi:hypothetical protein
MDGTVTATGTAVLKRQPELMRVQVEVQAKGKDLKEALTKLKVRRETARSQLAMLKSVPGSIEFGEAAVTVGKTERQRQLELMIMQRLRTGPEKKPAPIKQNLPVIVASTLKVDLPLTAADPDELLLAASELQEQVKALDLGGLKELQKMSPEEEEVAKGLKEFLHDPATLGGQPGEPTFLFVSKISEDDRAKIMAEAFDQARQEAARLAKAAGAELGPLTRLHNPMADLTVDQNEVPNADSLLRKLLGVRTSPTADSAPSPNEAVGKQPEKVTYRVTVTASFLLKMPPPRSKR